VLFRSGIGHHGGELPELIELVHGIKDCSEPRLEPEPMTEDITQINAWRLLRGEMSPSASRPRALTTCLSTWFFSAVPVTSPGAS